MSDDRLAWLVWKEGPRGVFPSIYYGALPESHDGKRGVIGTPRPLTGEDRELTLDALAAKYPPASGVKK